jgi:hypothetical protein
MKAGHFTARLSASDGFSASTRLVQFYLSFYPTATLLSLGGGSGGGGLQSVYTAPSGVIVTASHTTRDWNGLYEIKNMFNNTPTAGASEAGFWLTDATDFSTVGWLSFDLAGVVDHVEKIVIYPVCTDNGVTTLTEITSIETSSDGVNWSQVHGALGISWTLTPTWGDSVERALYTTDRYIKLNIAHTATSGTAYFRLNEIEIWGS